MAKRKPLDENGNTVRKKRQAFGASKGSETKAKSKHNETKSCFAKLPREVRRLIWTYVLGNEVLHSRSTCSYPPSRLAVCGVARPSQLYQLSKTLENDAIPLSELAEKYNPCDSREVIQRYRRSSAFSHRNCLQHHYNKRAAQTWGQNLAILRTCKMIYHEANNVLWTTNTFSFDDPDDCSTFMKNRTALQMQLITKLHFVLLDCNHGDLGKWQAKVSHTVIKKLRSLKEVHFFIKLAGIFANFGHLKQACAKFTGNFRIHAPLREATVIIDNRYYGDESQESQKLSHPKRLEWAEEFRNRLLDPEGAAKWQADRDAELAAQAEHRASVREIERIKFEEHRKDMMCPMDSAEACALLKQEKQDARDARDRRKRKKPFVAQPCGYMHRNDFERDDSAETTAI